MKNNHSTYRAILLCSLLLSLTVTSFAATIYVDDDAPLGGTGEPWAPFKYLQDALEAAQSGDEIWVYEGTYTPDMQELGPISAGDRTASFQLKNGVSVYGGFPTGATALIERDPDLYKTWLSGDLSGNDSAEVFNDVKDYIVTITTARCDESWSSECAIGQPYDDWECKEYDLNTDCHVDYLDIQVVFELGGYADNSYTIVTGSGTDITAFLDGVNIVNSFGNAGMVNNSGSPTINNCNFQNNMGGGMTNDNSSPCVSSCTFSENIVLGGDFRGGGGMSIAGVGTPGLLDCTFIGNIVYNGDGGGLFCWGGDTYLFNCDFVGNLVFGYSCAYDPNCGPAEGGGIAYFGDNIAVDNCQFIENSTESGRGGGFFTFPYGNTPIFNDCIFENNSAGGMFLYGGNASIGGIVRCISDEMMGYSGTLLGTGTLNLDSNSKLNMSSSQIQCNLAGTGTIQVDLPDELTIEGNAIVDLQHETDPALNGRIQCDGLLRIRENARVRNANIIVSRARFEGDVNISYSVITAESGAPYGQFFIEDTVAIEDNIIHADGDRYMDLNPEFFQGMISNNEIHVRITEGKNNSRGGLFELRGKPELTTVPNDPNFLVQLSEVPPFDPNSWTIKELKIEDQAKVNLTNRFDFHEPYDSGGADEVLYVENLILGKEAILNTSFNHIYYQNLFSEPNAVIINQPLLGFSLNMISCDDNNEFLVRIIHNNYKDPFDSFLNREHVKLVRNLQPDPSGMIKMVNLLDWDSWEVVSARAKGLFARSSEDNIMIWFEYLFAFNTTQIARQDVELVVYLSEDPGLTDNRIEVGRLKVPPQARPGSVGSGRFGTFRKNVNTQGLDFTRGTRIELELVGPEGACVYINNFDPQVYCRADYCSDVTGDTQVNVLDYLTVVGEYGTTADIPLGSEPSRTCLDSIFSQDGFVDWYDVMSWDWVVGLTAPHLCSIPLTGSTSTSPSIPQVSTGLEELPAELLIAGKRPSPSTPGRLEDKLYVFNSAGAYQTSECSVLEHANSRLIKDDEEGFYQLNLQTGVVPLADANSILGACRLSTPSDPRYAVASEVLVGLQGDGTDWIGRPLLDVALDNMGYAYVLPVVVDPTLAGDPYLAVAKLQLPTEPNTPPVLIQLYDDPPEYGDNQERNALRELELTEDGYLYVTNSHKDNESSILWTYDVNMSSPVGRVELGELNTPLYIPSPVGLFASRFSDDLYLASSLNAPDAVSTTLYRMSRADFSITPIEIAGMGHITGVTEDPVTGNLWVIGFRMSNIPDYLNIGDEPFYEPYVAQVSPGGQVQHVLNLSVDTNPNNDLALPVSILWTGVTALNPCEGADIDGSGSVDLGDVALMAQAWVSTPADIWWNPQCDISIPADNRIDLLDFSVLGRNWKKSGCQ